MRSVDELLRRLKAAADNIDGNPDMRALLSEARGAIETLDYCLNRTLTAIMTKSTKIEGDK